MALSNLNLLSASAYYALLYDMIKQRENPWLYNGTGYERIHNGGGDGNPTFGYGFNLAAFSADIVEQVILYAYNYSLTSQQSAGLDLIIDWKNGAPVYVNGSWTTLTNANIINMADVSLNGAPGAFGTTAQRAAVQSLALNDVQATRMLDVMIKGDLDLVHIEGGSGSWGYEDGLDYRLAEEGAPAYSTERAALLSVYYNAPSLIGPGVQNAMDTDDRPQLWYEIRYNHNHYDHNGLQNRRAEESDLLGLVSQAAKASPDAHIDEYALALDTLFNGYDRLGNRILTRIEARDGLDNFEDAVAPELQTLLTHFVLQPLGATAAPMIDYVQADGDNISEQMDAGSAALAGVPGGKGAADTVNLILGMGGDDFIRGFGGPDYLYGGDGDDTIYGDGGSTSISDSGHDLIDGGAGNDILFGGFGDEFIAGGDGDDMIFGDAGNDALHGEGHADTLDGGVGNDVLDGGAGRDSLIGADGDDTLAGAGGHDSLYGGNGGDDLQGGEGRDLLGGAGGDDVARGNEDDDRLFGGGGNDTLLGNDGNDSLTGGGGPDFLQGGAGDDTLNGRYGNDFINGGPGDDVFEFREGHGHDVYDDFVAGAGTDDVIQLIAFGAAFDTFADVIAAASDDGTNTTIDFGGGDTITLLNVVVADLHPDDFIFG